MDKNTSNEKAHAIGKQLAIDITEKWRAQCLNDFQLESHLELEFETHFRKFLMPTIRGAEHGSKKRYAGLIEKNNNEELIFKGLENVRSDWTDLAKDFQHELYTQVFNGEDPSDYIRHITLQVLNGEKDNDLIYRKRLRRKLAHYIKNVPPHVKAARLADAENKKQGLPLQYQSRGSIAYVITTNGPQPLEYQTTVLDYQHYVEKQLQPVADGILPFIGLSFDELVNAQMMQFS